MTTVKTSIGRRNFIKVSTLASGGMILGFSWLAGCKKSESELLAMPKEWFEINGYIKIGDNGVITIMSPNPEIGQNVKTSMPMLVAEELDVDWKKIIVEQAPLDTKIFQRQLAGGSQSIRMAWKPLRTAGASAKHMLKAAAAKEWNLPIEELTTSEGVISHKSGKKAGYGEMASLAAKMEVPAEVKLKDIKDFKIIGTDRTNVDGKKIITGKPLYGIDTKVEGMLIAMLIHPPAFGTKLKNVDLESVKNMPGIIDAFTIKPYENVEKQWCDTYAYDEVIVIVGKSTWEVMQAKKTVQPEWEQAPPQKFIVKGWANKEEKTLPSGLEDSELHRKSLENPSSKLVELKRKDGNPEAAFKTAAKIIERTYSAPFLAHNTMEPMNFFANVTKDKAIVNGPIQTPEFMEKTLSSRLGLPLENIEVHMTRMGGGFGRRLYGHFVVEAAVISQKLNKPIQLIYTREDDMTCGVYRPAYYVRYKAGIDDKNNIVAFEVNAGGIDDSPLAANRFPAGTIDNYIAKEYNIPSNITTGAFRAPRSNFIAGAEQSFIDELAEAVNKDPIDLRIELLTRAKNNPVGKDNDYDPDRYIGVLNLVRDKAKWGINKPGVHRGVSAYFCHDTYVAQVLDIVLQDNRPVIQKVTTAIDCGIVVNPIAATNLAEGGIIDGIGHAMYSGLTFKEGKPEQNNFNQYQLIRHSQAPKEIEVHFVKNEIDPTGLGEPVNPPVIGALANALYRATGKRFYHQPFYGEVKIVG